MYVFYKRRIQQKNVETAWAAKKHINYISVVEAVVVVVVVFL